MPPACVPTIRGSATVEINALLIGEEVGPHGQPNDFKMNSDSENEFYFKLNGSTFAGFNLNPAKYSPDVKKCKGVVEYLENVLQRGKKSILLRKIHPNEPDHPLPFI